MYIVWTKNNHEFIVGLGAPGSRGFDQIRNCDTLATAFHFIHFLNGGNLYDEDGKPTSVGD